MIPDHQTYTVVNIDTLGSYLINLFNEPNSLLVGFRVVHKSEGVE